MLEKMLNEVKAISKVNGVDLDRGFDMFRSNCEAGEENYKGTGEFDYTYSYPDKTFGELHTAVIEYDRREK